VVALNNLTRPSGLTIARLRNMAAGLPPQTPLLTPWAYGEGTEPLLMASAVNVGADLPPLETGRSGFTFTPV